MTIVCIGDSLTSGYGVPPGQGWVERCNVASADLWINAGIPGDTSGGVLTRPYRDAISMRSDYVVLMSGYNDILLTGSFEAAKPNIMAAMQHCIAAGVRPVLGIPPPSRPKPDNPWHDLIEEDRFYRQSEAFCDWLHRLAKSFGYHTADFRARFPAGDSALFQADGIHPSAAGHRRMAEVFLDSHP